MITLAAAEKAFRERTVLEKVLLVIVCLLLLTLITYIVATVAPSPNLKNSVLRFPVCNTTACVAAGSAILRSLNRSADPCSDFYAYCCGNWLKTQKLPPNVEQIGMYEKLREDVTRKVNDLLSQDNITLNETIATRNARRFYKSCIDEDYTDRQGYAPLLNFFSEIGGWPLIEEKWDDSSYNWLSAISEIQRRTSYGFILLLMVGADVKNTSVNILQLDQPSLSISRTVLLNPNSTFSKKNLDCYKNLFLKVGNSLGAKTEKLVSEFDEMIEFETKLAEVMYTDEDVRDFKNWYNKMQISKLQNVVPQINWLEYIQKITNSSLEQTDEGKIIQENEFVIVIGLSYFKKLFSSLNFETTKRQIANYLGWRVILNQVISLPSVIKKALNEFLTELGSMQILPDQWRMCTSLTNLYFNYETASLYIKKYFPDYTKKEVLKLIIDLKFEFEKILQNSSWMDEVTKKAALQKLRAMKINVGYPEWIVDDEFLLAYYKKTGKPAMTDGIFENDLTLSTYITKEAILRLRKTNTKQQWSMSPAAANAGYSRNDNGIIFFS